MSESTIQSPQPTQAQVVRLPVYQLEPNPFQLRVDPDTAIQQLMESIVHVGLLSPISVRQVGEQYEIISGHRRVKAFRLLGMTAHTEEERLRYETIPAQVLTDVSDAQMALSVLIENMQRVDLDEVEVARGLARYMRLEDLSIPQLAKKVAQEEWRVRRLLKLDRSPQFIKDAVSNGAVITVEVPKDEQAEQGEGGPGKRELRRLDLMGALEFARVYEKLVPDFHDTARENMAREKLEPAIRQALEEGWSFRDIQRECRKLRTVSRTPAVSPDTSGQAQDGESSPTVAQAEDTGTGTPLEVASAPTQEPPAAYQHPAWEWVGGEGGDTDILIHPSKFGVLTPLQRKGMRILLRKLDAKLGPEELPAESEAGATSHA